MEVTRLQKMSADVLALAADVQNDPSPLGQTLLAAMGHELMRTAHQPARTRTEA